MIFRPTCIKYQLVVIVMRSNFGVVKQPTCLLLVSTPTQNCKMTAGRTYPASYAWSGHHDLLANLWKDTA
jgi:hypothetical protein